MYQKRASIVRAFLTVSYTLLKLIFERTHDDIDFRKPHFFTSGASDKQYLSVLHDFPSHF